MTTPDFDHKVLEDADMDPYDIGYVAPKGAKNPYRKNSASGEAFARGYKAKHGPG